MHMGHFSRTGTCVLLIKWRRAVKNVLCLYAVIINYRAVHSSQPLTVGYACVGWLDKPVECIDRDGHSQQI